MPVKVKFYKFASSGGCVDIENEGGNSVTLVESRSHVGPRALKRRAAQKLRALADKLEAETSPQHPRNT